MIELDWLKRELTTRKLRKKELNVDGNVWVYVVVEPLSISGLPNAKGGVAIGKHLEWTVIGKGLAWERKEVKYKQPSPFFVRTGFLKSKSFGSLAVAYP